MPEAILKSLPPCSIAFPVAPEPAEFVPAKAPQELLLQIQQLMGLFTGKTYTLRDRLRWNAPDQGMYNKIQCWPPHPDDAKRLITDRTQNGKMTLLPPEPQLADQPLQFWAESLHLSTDRVEFLYHTLTLSAILHAGSPVRINQTLVQKWLALPPSRQIVILYQLYTSISLWAEWWSDWRDGQFDTELGFAGLLGVDLY